MNRVVIVGAGLAGVRCASALRRNGYSGDIDLLGDEADTPYDRPPLSKTALVAENLDEASLALARPDELTSFGWRPSTRAVALEVSEGQSGSVTFDWAGAETGGATDRWTATFTEAPQPRLAYTCGRVGQVAADFAAQNNALQLRLQDGAGGQLALQFQRRS